MNWVVGRVISRILLPITRICTRQCPECGARNTLTWFNEGITEREVSIDELKWAGELLGPLDQVEISGGEPTLHSKFEELSNNWANIFQCSKFLITTNGHIATRPDLLPLLRKYQAVYVSHYTASFAQHYTAVTGKPVQANTHEVEAIQEFLKSYPEVKFWVQTWRRHVTNSNGPFDINRCEQHTSNMLSYYERRLFGCCVSYALDYRGKSIPLTQDWRDHVAEMDTPCETCYSSQGIPIWMMQPD